MPLTNLWSEQEDIIAERKRHLNEDNIREILKEKSATFVIADIGQHLQWIQADKTIDFWKNELKPHLIPDNGNFQLEQFPDNYAYRASEWLGKDQRIIILLEKYH